MLLECLTVSATDASGTTASGELHGLFCGSGSHETLPFENVYATLPMLVAPSACAYAYSDEEELHTSFEQAISDRVTAVNSKLRRISSERPASPASAAPLQAPVGMTNRLLHSFERCQQRVRLASFALLLLLVGFDLMGLLVLYMH